MEPQAVWTAFKAAVERVIGEHPLSAILCLAENAIGSRFRRDRMTSSKCTPAKRRRDKQYRCRRSIGACRWSRMGGKESSKPDINHEHSDIDRGRQHIRRLGMSPSIYYAMTKPWSSCAVSTGTRLDWRASATPCHISRQLAAPDFAPVSLSMRKSVANRSNAQSACAAQFIGKAHPSQRTPWLHLDIAGAAFFGNGKRHSGFGMHAT